MPLQKIQFRPGLNREGTDYSNEGGWYDGDKVRFRSGFPEKIGGWTQFSTNTYVGVCRNLWNWVDLNSNNYVGVGTSKKYYIAKGGSYNDITPITTNVTLTGPFTTSSASTTVIVSDPTYTPNAGDYVIFSGATAIGGVLVSGEYVINSILSSTTYTITAANAATSTATGGGTVVTQYEYPVGLDVYTTGNGWGAGSYSPTIPVTLSNNPFVTSSGSGVVTVSQPAHGLSAGQYVAFSGASSLTSTGIFAGMINNTFTVTASLTASTYSITLPSSFVSTATTTSGGATVVSYPQYGTRGWGAAATVGIGQQLRLWSSDNYGQNLVLAPRGGNIYYWLAASGVGTRAQSLSSLATAASYTGSAIPSQTLQVISSAIQRFVIAFGANGYTDPTFNPMLVRWSDQANEYQWVPAVTNQSGEFALTNGSSIVGSRATRQEILVWTDTAIYSMQYLGAPYVWGFQILMDNISCISPNAMVTVNNVTYWMGQEKFYMYSGRVETLPCSLRQYIFDDINQDQAYEIFAGANEGYNEVWWFYVSNSSGTNQIDKYVIYNYLDRVWYYGTMSRTAWLDGLSNYPIAARYTYAAAFTGSISDTTLTVSNITSGAIGLNATLVGSGIRSGTVVTSFITGTGGVGTYGVNYGQTVSSESMSITGAVGQLLLHETSVDDVSGPTPLPIDSYVQSSDFDIGDGHNFGFVWRILPDVNFNGSTTNQPTVTMTIKPRQNSGSAYGQADNPSVVSLQNYSSVNVYNIQQFTGQVYTRLRGRQLAFRIESNTLGVAWQLGSPRMDIRPDGRR
jgi:hypothetical protein